MNNTEQLNATATGGASVASNIMTVEECEAHGTYYAECIDKDGNVKWRDTIDNIVMTAGKNLALDTFLAGSAYTAACYMGLISSISFTGSTPMTIATDTMASHSTWYENNPTTYYPGTANRVAVGWTSASGGSKVSTTTSFSIITIGGTVKGCFIVFGSGAVSTLASTAGTLYSAGLFTGGDKVVAISDTLNVTYTASL